MSDASDDLMIYWIVRAVPKPVRYLCNETSGNLVPTFGSGPTLTAVRCRGCHEGVIGGEIVGTTDRMHPALSGIWHAQCFFDDHWRRWIAMWEEIGFNYHYDFDERVHGDDKCSPT